MHMFTEPNGLKSKHLLIFDFPVDYHAPRTRPNEDYNQTPAKEALYGQAGLPRKEQGHPYIAEQNPREPEDARAQDQIVDLDRNVLVCHTGRLSGNFAQYLACEGYVSRIQVLAHPVSKGGAPITLYDKQVSLAAQSPAPDVWFWEDPSTMKELLYSVRAEVDPRQVQLDAEEVYKLVAKWGFWDVRRPGDERRMSISGFDDGVSFQVVEGSGPF